METEDAHTAHVYQKFNLVIEKGSGAILWDINGKRYIDCMGGYGVSLVGHCHPRVVEAIHNQVEKLITCHGSLYNKTRVELLERLVKISPRGLEKIYLCNSGAEAVECAIKLARKHTGKNEIIAFTGSYHGKTLGALSATWNPKYREPFEPLVPGFKFVPFGKIEKVDEAISEKTAAILIEPIQGESGIHVPPNGFLEALRKLCNEREILLIFDEVQSGLGRTGKMWASEHWGVVPDVMCVAKGIAGGIPMGATLATADIMSSLKMGEHTSTFGGNPLACAAASATIDVILEEKLVERAAVIGEYFKKQLSQLQEQSKIIRELRGLGLMLGMELRFDVQDILSKAINQGVILLYAGKTVLRFLPPLIIEKTQIDTVVNVLKNIISEEERIKLQHN
ncbi:aspartate aminotransferase family protein [Candidatus Bathyarchaeota archaeon]|nr:aspartate aminotransferase family protein [Candidatus Bathyarchaeota archaeon]